MACFSNGTGERHGIRPADAVTLPGALSCPGAVTFAGPAVGRAANPGDRDAACHAAPGIGVGHAQRVGDSGLALAGVARARFAIARFALAYCAIAIALAVQVG